MSSSEGVDFALTPDELASFHQNGYLGPVTIHSGDEMDRMWKVVQRESLDRSRAAYPEAESGTGAANIVNYEDRKSVV